MNTFFYIRNSNLLQIFLISATSVLMKLHLVFTFIYISLHMNFSILSCLLTICICSSVKHVFIIFAQFTWAVCLCLANFHIHTDINYYNYLCFPDLLCLSTLLWLLYIGSPFLNGYIKPLFFFVDNRLLVLAKEVCLTPILF